MIIYTREFLIIKGLWYHAKFTSKVLDINGIAADYKNFPRVMLIEPIIIMVIAGMNLCEQALRFANLHKVLN